MALIKCKECGHTISDKAVQCPKCGAPVQKEIVIQSAQEEQEVEELPNKPVEETGQPNEYAKKNRITNKTIVIAVGIMLIIVAIISYRYYSPFYALRERAEKGGAEDQYELGLCYYNGTKVIRDYDKAVNWFRKAAEQEHPDAIIKLVECYENEQGNISDEEGGKWFFKAMRLNKEFTIQLKRTLRDNNNYRRNDSHHDISDYNPFTGEWEDNK